MENANERLELDFQYALKQNNIDETYFHQIFAEQFWKDNRTVLVRAFLELSTLDSIESFGGHCRHCGVFNSDRVDNGICYSCRGELFTQPWGD